MVDEMEEKVRVELTIHVHEVMAPVRLEKRKRAKKRVRTKEEIYIASQSLIMVSFRVDIG